MAKLESRWGSLACLLLAGCAGNPVARQSVTPNPPPQFSLEPSPIRQAQHQETTVPQIAPEACSLSDFIRLTEERHPRLAQVQWAVETARGKAIQAGLYPNPVMNLTADELGDRQGPAGILSLPQISQEIVTGDKLGLSQTVAFLEADQASLNVISERYRLITEVRQNYWQVVVLQKRVDVLTELIKLAEQSVENAEKLLKAKEVSELDVVQLEVDRERYRAELIATQRSLPAALEKLAASVGLRDLKGCTVTGDPELALPEYNLDQLKNYMLGMHPDIKAAELGEQKAIYAVRRAEVEPTPNVTVSAGYVRQSQNRSNDWMLGVSLPLPLWNKNQGGILAAKAQHGEAISEVKRVQTELSGKLAASYADYTAARTRADHYKNKIIPRAQRSLQLSQKAYQGGQFEYLRVLQAQRAIAEARLEYLKALGDQWQAGSSLAGLMLEDRWPN